MAKRVEVRLLWLWLGRMLSVVVAALTSACFGLGTVNLGPCSGHGFFEPSKGCVCAPGYGGVACEACAEGYQDNDHDRECQPSCATAGLRCGTHQRCDDASGTAACVCETGYAGAECDACAASHQDNDQDGICAPGCALAGMSCGGHGACNDQSGVAVCVCDPGYQDHDHDAVCVANCGTAALGCVRGQCDDAGGTPLCVCATDFEGAKCDRCRAGLQDNDADGACRPSCATLGYTCSGLGTCSDATGVARCACGAGLADDGQGNCVELTFIVTAVNDGLDQNDLSLMASGLQGLGYQKIAENRDVSTAELASYFGQDVTLVYHTGHGNDGVIATSTGALSTSTGPFAARNIISATCLTLTDPAWKDAFGPTTETFMGYTEVSYDQIDDAQVQMFVAELGSGRSMLEAWYLSNAAINDLADRWAAYARDNTGAVVEYSARTHKQPPVQTASMKALGGAGTIRCSQALQDDVADRSAMFRTVAVLSAEASWSSPLRLDLAAAKPVTIGPDLAVEVAEAWLWQQGGLPADAELAAVVPLLRTSVESGEAEVIAYEVRYGRTVAGLPVRGNALADSIIVWVRSAQDVRGMGAWRYWPKLAQSAGAVAKDKAEVLSVAEAVRRAVPSLERVTKTSGGLDLVAAEPVYGTTGPGATALVPAYALTAKNGVVVVIDGRTGEFLR